MTDSEYAIKCMGSYGYKLAIKHWKSDKPIPNFEKVKAGFTFFQNYPNVTLQHVRAHTGKKDAHSIGNEWADKLATSSIQTHHIDTQAYLVQHKLAQSYGMGVVQQGAVGAR